MPSEDLQSVTLVRPVVILPFDGMPSAQAVVAASRDIFQKPLARKLIKAIKFNDALHFPRVGPAILGDVREVVPDSVEILPDFKIADVSATDVNTLKRYAPYKPEIITVTSTVTFAALAMIQETLPGTKIAIVDTLTDMSEEECQFRYHGQTPFEKISHALDKFEEHYGDKNPISIVICSPRETTALKKVHPQYEYGNPGIRSPHMLDDHQKRTTSVYTALKNGADYVILGAQMTKGAPENGISVEQSQEITFREIQQFFEELKTAA